MWVRRSVSGMLLMVWLSLPGLIPLAAAPHPQDCTDHVCQCREMCPTKRPAGESCHKTEDSPSDCAMSGRCNHDDARLLLLLTRSDSMLWTPSPLRFDPVWSPLPRGLSHGPERGHARLDQRPPRPVA